MHTVLFILFSIYQHINFIDNYIILLQNYIYNMHNKHIKDISVNYLKFLLCMSVIFPANQLSIRFPQGGQSYQPFREALVCVHGLAERKKS